MARAAYEYPGWVPPAPKPSVPGRGSVNQSSSKREVNVTAAAMGSPLPIVYGRAAVAPLIFAVAQDGTSLLLGCAWCVGKINQIVQIYNGDAPLDPSWVVASYTGDPAQGVDPTLAGAIAGYADTLTGTIRGQAYGVAYTVLRIPASADFPSGIQAVIEGKMSWSATATDAEINMASRGTATSSGDDGANPADKAIDDQIFTFWRSNNGTAHRRWIDVALAGTTLATRITLNWGATTGGYNFSNTGWRPVPAIPPIDYELQYWDGAAWQPIPNGRFVNRRDFFVEITFTPPTNFDRVRVYIHTGVDRFLGKRPDGSYTYINPAYQVTLYELKVFEVRAQTHLYSANPGLAIGDFCADKINGFGATVDPTSMEELIDFCDIPDPKGFPRHTIGLAIINKQPLTSHLDALRQYANCWISRSGSTFRFTPNAKALPAASLTEDIMVEGSVDIEMLSVQDIPTAVGVRYTDISVWPWTEPLVMVYHPDFLSGALEYRESILDLPGIHSEDEATRVATQRLNHFSLVSMRFSCTVFDEGREWYVGQVIEVTHSRGLDAKKMRLINKETVSEGRYQLELEDYDDLMYEDTVQTVPSNPHTNLSAPDNVPALVRLAVQVDTDRLVVSWDAEAMTADYPFPLRYRVEVQDGGGVVVWQSVTAAASATSDALPGGVTYTVRVRPEIVWGMQEHTGAWSSQTAAIP